MSNVSQFTGLGWVPLETKEITTPSFTVDFSTNIDDTYNNYVIVSTNTLSGVSANIEAPLKTGGVAINTGYRWLRVAPPDTSDNDNTTRDSVVLTQYQGSFVTYFMNLRSSDPFKSINTESTGYVDTTIVLRNYEGALMSTSIIDGIILTPSSGTFDSGKFTLYGIREL